MKKDTLILTAAFVAVLLIGTKQYQKYLRNVPFRYLKSDTFHSLFKDVSGLYDTNSIVCIPDVINGEITIKLTPTNKDAEKELMQTIMEGYLNKRVNFIITTTNTTFAEIQLTKE